MTVSRYRFIGPYIIPHDAVPTIATIQREVAAQFKIPLRLMRAEARSWEASHPRQVAMYLARRRTFRTYAEIGLQFGRRDHSTVIHAMQAVEKRRAEDRKLDALIRSLEARL